MLHDGITENIMSMLEEKSAQARDQVKRAILERKTGSGKVDKAIEQYLSKWNDITRPGVLALACEAVGGNLDDAVTLQTALLFIDAMMDIHDDIIDESVVKKGEKTVYGKLGKGSTLLIGDAFIVRGFNYLIKTLETLPKNRRTSIMDTVDYFLSEVVEAHISESSMKSGKLGSNPEAYFQILNKKGVDIEGHMKVGAIFGGGSARDVQALSKYGRNVGTLLAVRSDFVDVFEPTELMHRIKFEILPLPLLYSLRSRKHGTQIREILKRNHLGDDDCNELVKVMYDTKEVMHLRQHLINLKDEAIQSLDLLSKEEMKDELKILASFMIEDL